MIWRNGKMKFWKKVLASVTAGVLCLGGAGLSGAESVQESMGTVLSASAYVPYSYDGRYEGLYYNVTDTGEIEITGCYEYVRKVNIPIEIDGKSVTSIGSSAFYDCTSLTEITIPDSVTSIRECAFYDCTSLTEITIPDSVTSIGSSAFYDCTSLTEITIPDSVTSIGQYAFCGCTSLTEITIPDSVTSIGEGVFFGCTSLTEITIPDSVTHIENHTFDDCTSLRSVTFLSPKTGIEEGAFSDCNADMKFITEDTYDQKGEAASVATNVTQLTVKHKEGKIPAGAYEGSKRLKEVTLEEGITLIEDDAFANCDNLEKIVIPKSVTGIRYTAFTYDTKLTMYGYKDTYAERYADMLGFPFVALDDSDTPPVTTTTTTSTTETTPTTAAPITGGLVCGDINLDGRVDITDAVLLNKFCSGAITLDDTAKKNADCNGDGEVTGSDSTVLLQFLVSIINTLPYTE